VTEREYIDGFAAACRNSRANVEIVGLGNRGTNRKNGRCRPSAVIALHQATGNVASRRQADAVTWLAVFKPSAHLTDLVPTGFNPGRTVWVIVGSGVSS